MRGLDCGTGNYVAVTPNGIKAQRNAFLTIDKAATTMKSLKRLSIPFVEINNKLHVVGKSAFEYAQIFNNKDLKRPMAKGLLNPKERDAFPVLREIIKGLLGAPTEENELCIYCVPGKPIDNEQMVDYHEDVLKQIIQSLGYNPKPLNEAEALAYAGLVDNNLTGITISMGAGMCNVCIMYAGMTALTFSVARGGDFIDGQVALDCGITKAKAQYIKESADYTIKKAAAKATGSTIQVVNDQDLTREQRAVRTYYGVLIRYLLANIAKQFEDNDSMPNFPEPIPIVVGGGTSMVSGFIDIFEEEFNNKDFPIEIKEIKLVEEPFTAVARGCLAEAQLEEEDDD
jgi:hypothetical protein